VKLASVDIGTNSSRLFIVDYNNKEKFLILKQDLVTTRLGEGVDSHQKLKKTAVKRVLDALKKFKKETEKFKVDEVMLVGTSALRDVKNSQILVNKINELTNWNLQIINGLKEAQLIYKGVSIDLTFPNYIIIDIGGGSTEFIWQQEDDICYKSLNMGAVRMTERFILNPKAPLLEKEYKLIKNKVVKLLENKMPEEILKVKAVGVGGTITSLAAMSNKMKEYNSKKIHDYRLNLKEINSLLSKLKNNNLKEREQIPGLQAERADIIIAGTIILHTIMSFFDLKEIRVSEKDILWGMIRELGMTK
jgi:exopolyphosphatase/guanosine-5'-triphosphate,3'-diphosphate pyrophosphatase